MQYICSSNQKTTHEHLLELKEYYQQSIILNRQELSPNQTPK